MLPTLTLPAAHWAALDAAPRSRSCLRKLLAIFAIWISNDKFDEYIWGCWAIRGPSFSRLFVGDLVFSIGIPIGTKIPGFRIVFDGLN